MTDKNEDVTAGPDETTPTGSAGPTGTDAEDRTSFGHNLLLSARQAGPAAASTFMKQVFDIAINGRGPFNGAVEMANRQRVAHTGNSGPAVDTLIEQHVRLAGGQGFVTGLGGIATMVVALPANLTGLTIVQARMVAAIAHLHGYDLASLKVRTAVAAVLLGPDGVQDQISKGRLPSRPLAIATAPAFDKPLADTVLNMVGVALMARLGGKHLGTTLARRIPLLGGGVGMIADGYSTYTIGRYAAEELVNRRPQIRADAEKDS
jgi:hypothetical protein